MLLLVLAFVLSLIDFTSDILPLMFSKCLPLLLSNLLLINILNGFSVAETTAVGGVVVCVGDYMDVTNSAFEPTLNGVKA